LEILFTFFTKQAALMRRSTVLRLPPQLGEHFLLPAATVDDTKHGPTKRARCSL